MHRLKLEYRCRKFVAIFLLEEVALFLYTLLILKSLQCFLKLKKYICDQVQKLGRSWPDQPDRFRRACIKMHEMASQRANFSKIAQKRQPGRSKFSIFRARDYEAVTPRDKFCKFIGNFLVPVSPISFGEFFKIWQHSKTRCQFHDERFKFTNQKLQKFLTMKTTYFNITEKLARSHPFLFLLMKLWRSNLPVHKILKHFTEEI